MKNLFDKSKCYNYLTAIVFTIVAVIFMRQLSITLWKFDIFNVKQLSIFFRFIASGKIFYSLKYISFIITFIGVVCLTYGGILISMNIKFKKEENISNGGDSENIEESATNSVVKQDENAITPEQENQNSKTKPETTDNKFAVYDNPVSENVLNTELQTKPNQAEKNLQPVKENNQPSNNSVSEEEEREKLQSKIKEIMAKMKEKNNTQKEHNLDNKEEKLENAEKILSPMTFAKEITPDVIDMNFKNISENDNANMEQTLISAGFKVLSEIRIGKTGIDYLAVAKDKLVVIQLDTTDGNWFASEDKVESQQNPVWFSDLGNKISPVSRALEAKENIENLIKGEFELPIKPIVCLTKSNVVNYEEAKAQWDKLGVEIVNLYKDDSILTPMKTLNEIYPISSQEEIAESDINKLIDILEKAEIPEN